MLRGVDYDVEALDVDLHPTLLLLVSRVRREEVLYLAGRSIIEEMESSLFASCDYAWCSRHFECTSLHRVTGFPGPVEDN